MAAWKKILEEDHKTEADAHAVSVITGAKSATEISAEIDGDVSTHKTEADAHEVSKITNAKSATEITAEIDGDVTTHDENVGAHASIGFSKIPKQATEPGSPSDGDLWYDTTNKCLKVYVA